MEDESPQAQITGDMKDDTVFWLGMLPGNLTAAQEPLGRSLTGWRSTQAASPRPGSNLGESSAQLLPHHT